MARVWDVTKGKELFDLPHERIYWLHGIAFSPDGKHIVTLGEKRENAPSHGSGRLHVWDGAGGQPLRVVSLPDMRPRCLAVSPDGRWAAVGGYQALPRLYDLALGKEVRTFPGLSVYDLAFSPDGTMLAAACYGWTVRFWEVATGEEIFELGRTENLPKVIGGSEPQVAFSPDGRVVAATGGMDMIRFRDAVTGKELFRLRGHDSTVNCLAFSPDGKRLVSGASNSTALVWDLTAPGRTPPPLRMDLTPADLDALWSDLGASARKAHAAIWAMSAAPDKSVSFLKDHLRPAQPSDPERVRRWLAELDSGDFKVREAAARELRRLGERAEPHLRQALEEKPSPETRRRVEALRAAQEESPPPDVLRHLRAVGVLERVGTAEAREVLRTLAEGAPGARVTREAAAALARLERRAAAP